MARARRGSPIEDTAVPVGVALAQLRRKANITGEELGRRVGMSQAKISKIETGVTSASPRDVERIARELGASRVQIEQLVAQAERTRDNMADWRHSGDRSNPVAWQKEVGQLEEGTRVFRHFNLAVLSGLLQTSGYARGVFTRLRSSAAAADDVVSFGISEAVSARVRRQMVLDDVTKRFHFVMPEGLLRNVFSTSEDMSAQLARLRDVSRQDNVRLSIIADHTPWPIPPVHGFNLLDDRCVIIDLYNTAVVSRGQSDIRYYRRAFETLEAHATREVDPILAKYRRRYLRLAQEELNASGQ